MRIEPITDPEDPRVAMYRNLRDRDLQRDAGLFMAEGRFIVGMALGQSRFVAHSVLLTEAARESLEDRLSVLADTIPIYLASQGVMDTIVGFHIHRGCLGAIHRPVVETAEGLLAAARTPDECVVVLEDTANHDNVGGVFRSAAAFGVGAIFLTRPSCDPLYRKSVRVSMGGVLRVPFALIDSAADAARTLEAAGFTTIALAPDGEIDIGAVSTRGMGGMGGKGGEGGKVALFLGAEGPGLRAETLAACQQRVRIASTGLVDSLNLAVAAGIALHELAPLPLRSRV